MFLSFLELPVLIVFTSFVAGFYPVFTGFYSFYVFRSQFHVRFGTTVFFVVAFSFPSRASVANENTEDWCGHCARVPHTNREVYTIFQQGMRYKAPTNSKLGYRSLWVRGYDN